MLTPDNIERVYRGQPALASSGSLEEVLSPRQFEAASEAAKDKSYAEIGEIMGIGPRTVRTHLHGAYDKLGIYSKMGLAPYFPIEPDSELLEGKRLSDLGHGFKRLEVLEAICIGQYYGSIAVSRSVDPSTLRSSVKGIGDKWPDARGGLKSARVANGIRARAIPVIEAAPEIFGQHDIGELSLIRVAVLESFMELGS